jgi:O-antigen/teichoic acid export membrane protein
MIITNNQKQQAGFMAIAAIVNVLCNIILIPLLGINGVAIAKLISAIVFFIPNYLFVYRNIYRLNLIKMAIPAIVATVGTAIIFFILMPLYTSLAFMFGIIVFCAIVFLLGGVEKEDVHFVYKSFVNILQRS